MLRRICLRNIDVRRVKENPFRLRLSYDENEIIHMCESIRANGGIINPIIVRWKDGWYEICSGHRRWQAAKRLGEKSIPAIQCEINDEEMIQAGLVENLQRQDLNALEEARGLEMLKEKANLTHKELGFRVGKTEDFVAQRVRLLTLPDQIREMLSRDKINPTMAEAIASKSPEIQKRILALIEQGHELTTREISAMVDQIGKSTNRKPAETSSNGVDGQ